MFIKTLRCYVCSSEYPRTHLVYRCDCGGGLEIVYDYTKLKKLISWKKLRSRPFNHWRYEEFYPMLKDKVSLGEGGTPLVRSVKSSKIFFKLEGCNPTGSFKDRGSTLEISHAISYSPKKVICASTGNMGASVSAYCARAGLKCQIYLPSLAAGEKIEQIKSYGSQVTPVKGDYTLAMNMAYDAFENERGFLVGDYAFRGEGEKSVGYEIVDQMLFESEKLPSNIVVPIGNGTLISSIWKGLKEMKKVGLISKLPRMIGVQAKGCNPIEVAFIRGNVIKKQIPHTIAGAVACGDPLDAVPALRALEESSGTCVSVSDKELIKARRLLAYTQGIDSEPSGALSYAALDKVSLTGSTVCVVTGSGLKDLVHR